MNFLRQAVSVTSLIANQTMRTFQQNIRTISSSLITRDVQRKFTPLDELQPIKSQEISKYLSSLTTKMSAGERQLKRMHEKPFIKVKRKRKHVFDGQPFAKGVVLRTLVKKPRKPNSANRKCVLLRLSTGREMVAYVPGVGHNLQEHNVVLAKVARLRDTPGVKIKCIRGAYDLPHVIKRRD